jgi:hypothetical protein
MRNQYAYNFASRFSAYISRTVETRYVCQNVNLRPENGRNLVRRLISHAKRTGMRHTQWLKQNPKGVRTKGTWTSPAAFIR